MSIPFSRASRRASGDAFTRPSRSRGRLGDRGGLGRGRRRGSLAAALALVVHVLGRRALLLRSSSALASVASSALVLGRRRRAAVPGRDVLTLVADEGDRAADLDLAGVDDDLQQDAVGLRLDLLRHLVGVELVEGLALLDRIALALEPLDDRAGLHALAEPRELDLGRHG